MHTENELLASGRSKKKDKNPFVSGILQFVGRFIPVPPIDNEKFRNAHNFSSARFLLRKNLTISFYIYSNPT